jgi:hypothetical protein
METSIKLSDANYLATTKIAAELSITPESLVNYLVEQLAYEINEDTRELNEITELHELVKLNEVNLKNAMSFAAALNMKLSDFINDVLLHADFIDIDRIHTRKHKNGNNQHSCNCKTENSESEKEF